jgi:hypothetical protein
MRSTDGGATWLVVGDVVHDPKVDQDPYLWVDPLTDRVFNVPLDVACSWLAWSDDAGKTWDANPAVACAPPGHDHQKLATVPPVQGAITLGYPNIVYYAYNSFLLTGLTPVDGPRLGTMVATSIDGGRTFSPGQVVHASDCHRGIVGPPAVAPDGTAYIAKGTCQGLDVIVSRDSGKTWKTEASLDSVGALDDFAFDAGLAVDAAGNVYVAWPGADALLYLSHSTDAGRSWSAPVRVTPEGVTATVYSSLVAGAPGKVALAYASTTRDPSGWPHRASSFSDDATVWDLRVAVLDDALAAEPQPRTLAVTDASDPLQRGCIWMRGGASDCRNLYDFVTLTQRDGTLYLAYTDGCDACRSASESRASHVMVAISVDSPLR